VKVKEETPRVVGLLYKFVVRLVYIFIRSKNPQNDTTLNSIK